jgi:hypothetical protein
MLPCLPPLPQHRMVPGWVPEPIWTQRYGKYWSGRAGSLVTALVPQMLYFIYFCVSDNCNDFCTNRAVVSTSLGKMWNKVTTQLREWIVLKRRNSNAKQFLLLLLFESPFICKLWIPKMLVSTVQFIFFFLGLQPVASVTMIYFWVPSVATMFQLFYFLTLFFIFLFYSLFCFF